MTTLILIGGCFILGYLIPLFLKVDIDKFNINDVKNMIEEKILNPFVNQEEEGEAEAPEKETTEEETAEENNDEGETSE